MINWPTATFLRTAGDAILRSIGVYLSQKISIIWIDCQLARKVWLLKVLDLIMKNIKPFFIAIVKGYFAYAAPVSGPHKTFNFLNLVIMIIEEGWHGKDLNLMWFYSKMVVGLTIRNKLFLKSPTLCFLSSLVGHYSCV